jgi:acyl-CoA thioester hydrolase
MLPLYRHELRVPEEVVDRNGHVNNVTYVQWMQDAAVRHADAAGCTKATFEMGSTWVIRSHKIEYYRPAFADDHIVVLTWVSNFRKARSLRKYKFLRATDGIVLAKGETDWVFIDADSGRPRAIPDHIARTFEVIPPDEEP